MEFLYFIHLKKIVDRLKNKKSSGIDDIANSLIKL